MSLIAIMKKEKKLKRICFCPLMERNPLTQTCVIHVLLKIYLFTSTETSFAFYEFQWTFNYLKAGRNASLKESKTIIFHFTCGTKYIVLL